MYYSDLDLTTQTSLIGLTVVVGAGFLIRAMVFFRHEIRGIRPLYPNSWNAAQCQALERFRLLVGLGLVTLWAAYLFVVPWMLPKWPLKYLEVISLIAMLSISYAWAVLLASRNWTRFDALPRSFLVIFAFLVLWWGTAFSAVGWMLTEASARPSIHLIPPGVYAAQGMGSSACGPEIPCAS
jgi:hypothetical protein